MRTYRIIEILLMNAGASGRSAQRCTKCWRYQCTSAIDARQHGTTQIWGGRHKHLSINQIGFVCHSFVWNIRLTVADIAAVAWYRVSEKMVAVRRLQPVYRPTTIATTLTFAAHPASTIQHVLHCARYSTSHTYVFTVFRRQNEHFSFIEWRKCNAIASHTYTLSLSLAFSLIGLRYFVRLVKHV